MSDEPPARPEPTLKGVNNILHSIDLTGMLAPGQDVNGEQAVMLLTFDNIPDIFIPVFSSMETFLRGMKDFDMKYEKIKKIDDGVEFAREVPPTINGAPVRIAIDIHSIDKAAGKMRWTEVIR
jgi:hypothetical protein